MRKTAFTMQAQTLLKDAYMTRKLIIHSLEELDELSVCKNQKKRKSTAQEDGSIEHTMQSASSIRRKCRANLKLAVNVLEVVAQQITKTSKKVGGFEQPEAFARRYPWTRSLPWCERNVAFELKQFIHDPDNNNLTSGPQAPPRRRRALETLSGPGNSNVVKYGLCEVIRLSVTARTEHSMFYLRF